MYRDILQKREEYLRLVVLTICMWSLYYFFFVVRPWFFTLSFGYPPTSVVLPADPHIYWRFSKFIDLSDLALNVFGPTMILKIFASNTGLVFMFNAVLTLYAVSCFAKGLRRSKYLIMALLFINPMILAQIFYPNKELYMFVSSLFFLAYGQLGKRHYLLYGLLLLPFTKLEYIVISLAWLFLSQFSVRVWTATVVALSLILSVFYNFIPGINNKLTVLFASQHSGEAGLTENLHYMASHYNLFVLTIVPKIANAMLGGVIDFLRYPAILSTGFTTVLSSLFMSLMAFVVAWKFRFKNISQEHLFLFLWFIAVATVPFALHRYLFPCYPFLYSILLKAKA